MTPDTWQRVKAVVGDALERERNERDAFVAAACGDDTTLRREVESMLALDAEAIDRCVERLSDGRGLPDDAVTGTRLGSYEVVREIGRGGMGAVYLARRADEQFDKSVAIKILKRGTDTDEVLRRFRAERQILARLEHTNIARLFDGGTTEDGLPYFVMEHVVGERITDYCRASNLSVRQRVELFLKVCAAVEFAHRNLVVHRDLKPGNILVTAEGEPKLLDFGIAKLISTEADDAQLTITQQQRFTPGYASPEQVRGDAVTTASDVYALGALLYALLADRPPHDFPTATPSPTELFRVIVEQEPPRASAVAPSAETRRELRGDLDNILLTALRKEPDRRYSGVPALAEDLRRYLASRPVRARPATVGYRASKFIQRNKLVTAGAALLLATLLAGIAATLWQARKAALASARAERRFQEVRKLARAVVFDYHDLIEMLPGSTPARERLVRDALEYLDNLASEAGNDRELMRELATAYEKIGKVQGNSYYANLGDVDGAVRSYQKSVDLRTQLLASGGGPEVQSEAAQSYTGLGDVLYEKGDLQGALASYERAVDAGERALASNPQSKVFRLSAALAWARIGDVKGNEQYANLGDTAGALAAFRRAQELIEPLYAADENDPETISRLANALSRVGMLSCASGHVAAALPVHERAVAMMERSVAAHPNSQTWALELLALKHFLRFALEDNGQYEEAISVARELLERLAIVAAADPKNRMARRNAAVTHNMLGKDLLLVGDIAGALASHRAALDVIEQLAAGAAVAGDLKSDKAVAFWGLGNAEAAADNYDAALQHYGEALKLREPVITAEPANARARDDVARIYADMGKTLAAAGRTADAMNAFARALPLAEELSANAPSNARLRARLALRYAEAGRLHLQIARARATEPSEARADWQGARDYLSRSDAIWEQLRRDGRLIPAHAAEPQKVKSDLATCGAALE